MLVQSKNVNHIIHLNLNKTLTKLHDFLTFTCTRKKIKFFQNCFSVDIADVDSKLQIEVIELQHNNVPKTAFIKSNTTKNILLESFQNRF